MNVSTFRRILEKLAWNHLHLDGYRLQLWTVAHSIYMANENEICLNFKESLNSIMVDISRVLRWICKDRRAILKSWQQTPITFGNLPYCKRIAHIQLSQITDLFIGSRWRWILFFDNSVTLFFKQKEMSLIWSYLELIDTIKSLPPNQSNAR